MVLYAFDLMHLDGYDMNWGWRECRRKRADAPNRSGRTETWLKIKCWRRERFAVIGLVPEGSAGLLKLRLARREGGELIYVGRTDEMV